MPLGEEQAIAKRMVEKNTPVQNEFMDSQKITIEEAPGHQNVSAHSKANGPCSGITLQRKDMVLGADRGKQTRSGGRSARDQRLSV